MTMFYKSLVAISPFCCSSLIKKKKNPPNFSVHPSSVQQMSTKCHVNESLTAPDPGQPNNHTTNRKVRLHVSLKKKKKKKKQRDRKVETTRETSEKNFKTSQLTSSEWERVGLCSLKTSWTHQDSQSCQKHVNEKHTTLLRNLSK